MENNSQLKVPETVWYEATSRSPDIPQQPGFVFRAVQATSESGPTVALAAAYRLGSPFTDYYGGQLPRPIWVVAVDEGSGSVYQADMNSPDHPPIVLEVSDQDAESAMPGWSYESAHFNVDLAALLGLPEQSGRYRVFLWLDDLTSSVAAVNVPANPARGKGRPVASQPSKLVQFGPDPAAPKPKSGEVALVVSSEPDDISVHGAWTPEKAVDPNQVVLWLMAASHRDRTFGWVAIRADELPDTVAAQSFRFNALDLVKTSGIAQKVFVSGLSSKGVSKVLVIGAP